VVLLSAAVAAVAWPAFSSIDPAAWVVSTHAASGVFDCLPERIDKGRESSRLQELAFHEKAVRFEKIDLLRRHSESVRTLRQILAREWPRCEQRVLSVARLEQSRPLPHARSRVSEFIAI
jgi:hypothetical protein